jgi:uncharacterized protein YndB with AHSA1/START domain
MTDQKKAVSESDVARFIDRWTIEYVRIYPHPIDRVWRALTEPREFGAWFIPGSIELKVGGVYVFGGPDHTDFAGRIVALEPPRLIRFGGDGRHVAGGEAGWFQYELATVPSGTQMVFTQYFPPGLAYTPSPDEFVGGDLPVPGTPWKPGIVAGWHDIFDGLRDQLDGVPIGSRLPPSSFGAIARYWAHEQKRAGEFTAEHAERYARQLRVYENYFAMSEFYREFIRRHCPAV